MVQRVVVEKIDDLDGVSEAVDTVRFDLDQTSYEIDLSAGHAEELRAGLAAFIAHARKQVVRRRRAPRGEGTSPPDSREGYADRQAMRAWAREVKGMQIGNRGKIPEFVVAEYRAAHS